MDRLYILAIALVLAGAMSGGVFSVSHGNGNSTIINRFTGKGWFCNLRVCYPLETRD